MHAKRLDMHTGAKNAQQPSPEGLDETPCSRLVLQRRYRPSHGIPKPWTEWHDHPEPHQIAWGPGQYTTLEENIKAACEGYYALGQGCEFRMVRRTDETLWEYSANAQAMASPPESTPVTPCSDSPADETVCDCCEKPAVKTMSDKTSKWCANYFVGYYCDDCFAEVERVMKQTVEEEAAQAAIDPYAEVSDRPS